MHSTCSPWVAVWSCTLEGLPISSRNDGSHSVLTVRRTKTVFFLEDSNITIVSITVNSLFTKTNTWCWSLPFFSHFTGLKHLIRRTLLKDGQWQFETINNWEVFFVVNCNSKGACRCPMWQQITIWRRNILTTWGRTLSQFSYITFVTACGFCLLKETTLNKRLLLMHTYSF